MNEQAQMAGVSIHTALIVEDDIPLLHMIRDVLTMAGFETTTINNGTAALEAIAARRYDLFVFDVRLPDVSGMALCASARDHYGSDVVILVVTAESSTERLMTAIELGADDFVPKPFDLDELLARIDTCLQRIGNPRPRISGA